MKFASMILVLFLFVTAEARLSAEDFSLLPDSPVKDNLSALSTKENPELVKLSDEESFREELGLSETIAPESLEKSLPSPVETVPLTPSATSSSLDKSTTLPSDMFPQKKSSTSARYSSSSRSSSANSKGAMSQLLTANSVVMGAIALGVLGAFLAGGMITIRRLRRPARPLGHTILMNHPTLSSPMALVREKKEAVPTEVGPATERHAA